MPARGHREWTPPRRVVWTASWAGAVSPVYNVGAYGRGRCCTWAVIPCARGNRARHVLFLLLPQSHTRGTWRASHGARAPHSECLAGRRPRSVRCEALSHLSAGSSVPISLAKVPGRWRLTSRPRRHRTSRPAQGDDFDPPLQHTHDDLLEVRIVECGSRAAVATREVQVELGEGRELREGLTNSSRELILPQPSTCKFSSVKFACSRRWSRSRSTCRRSLVFRSVRAVSFAWPLPISSMKLI